MTATPPAEPSEQPEAVDAARLRKKAEQARQEAAARLRDAETAAQAELSATERQAARKVQAAEIEGRRLLQVADEAEATAELLAVEEAERRRLEQLRTGYRESLTAAEAAVAAHAAAKRDVAEAGHAYAKAKRALESATGARRVVQAEDVAAAAQQKLADATVAKQAALDTAKSALVKAREAWIALHQVEDVTPAWPADLPARPSMWAHLCPRWFRAHLVPHLLQALDERGGHAAERASQLRRAVLRVGADTVFDVSFGDLADPLVAGTCLNLLGRWFDRPVPEVSCALAAGIVEAVDAAERGVTNWALTGQD